MLHLVAYVYAVHTRYARSDGKDNTSRYPLSSVLGIILGIKDNLSIESSHKCFTKKCGGGGVCNADCKEISGAVRTLVKHYRAVLLSTAVELFTGAF